MGLEGVGVNEPAYLQRRLAHQQQYPRHLHAPGVEPPQPPTKLIRISKNGSISGQWEKSTVPNPLLVTTERTSNVASLGLGRPCS